MNLNDYALAGYEGRQTDSLWSSGNWLAEQAGKVCRLHNLHPLETKMSRGYSVLINRKYVVKFDAKTLEFVSIKAKG